MRTLILLSFSLLSLTPSDRIAYQHCHTTDKVPFTDPSCSDLDSDSDGDVDQSDFGQMQQQHSIYHAELLFVIRVDAYEPLIQINSREVVELLRKSLSTQPSSWLLP